MKMHPFGHLPTLSWLYRVTLFAVLASLPFSGVHAVPIPGDITVTGSTTFDDAFSFGPTSGSYDVTVGGATTSVGYAGSTPAGANPLMGTLTDTGDGFGFDGATDPMSAVNEEFAIGLDTLVMVTNSSATDSYDVVMKLEFDNNVDADGDDAYSDSELTLDIDLVEEFFSDLISDTLFGDEVGGVSQGTFGAALSDTGTAFFTLMLAPLASIDLDLAWTLEGGDFAGGLATASLSTFLSVDSVRNTTVPPAVSEPASLALLLTGLLTVPVMRRRAK